MTMKSSDLLPALRGLPTGESRQRMSSRDMIAGLVNADRAMYAAEFVSVASFGTWAVFPGVNVDDDLRETMTQAHEMAFSNYEGTLIEHFQEITERGPKSVTEFIGVLRGEAAVINAADALGFTNVDNVDDRLFVAFREAYRRLAADKSLYEQYRETAEGGENSITGLVNGLKGKMAEISIEKDKLLEQNGYTNVEMAKDATQEGWDFSGFNEAGEKKFFQVKTGGEGRVSEIINDMEANPDYIYPVTSKIYGGIAESRADLKDRLIDIGPDLDKHVRDELETLGHNLGLDIPDDLLDQLTDSPDYLPVEGINDGLETLSANMRIDFPDGIVDIIPYAAVIGGGARLIYSVVKTEKEFKAVDRTTKNQIQVVQTLTLMSRMGITTVLAAAGGMGGAAVGSAVPGIGNAVGGGVGIVIGAGTGMYLNKHLQPHMLNLALNITGLTHDDLFYYKNKPRINAVASTFQTKARELAAAPGL